MRFKIKNQDRDCITMTAAIALARAPKQLDIIADTVLSADIANHSDLSTRTKVKNHSDLSTNPQNANHSDLSTDRAKRIAARRKEAGVSTSALIAAAGLYPQTYFFALRGKSNTRASTFDALEKALDRFAVGYTSADRRTIGESCLRDLMIGIAVRMGLNPEDVLAQDFSSEKTNDDVYMRNCRVRRCAVYLMIEGMRFPKAAVARVAGFSRQAAHKTVTAIEKRRLSDPDLDRMLGDMMLKVRGERI